MFFTEVCRKKRIVSATGTNQKRVEKEINQNNKCKEGGEWIAL